VVVADRGLAVSEDYGRWWDNAARDDDWYRHLFSLRPEVHAHFRNWVERLGPINTMLEVGCGRGEPYGMLFRGNYRGCDIASQQIAACREKFPDQADAFFVADALRDDLHGPYDLVFSHAVVDHVPDIDLFLRRLAGASRKWVFVSCYNGWQEDLDAHEYRWVSGLSCFKNKVSPSRARETMQAAGFHDTTVYPWVVGKAPQETLIIAARGEGH